MLTMPAHDEVHRRQEFYLVVEGHAPAVVARIDQRSVDQGRVLAAARDVGEAAAAAVVIALRAGV